MKLLTARLLETGAKVGADSWQARVKIRHHIVNLEKKVFAAVSVQWDHAVLQRKHQEVFAVVTYMVS